MKPSQSEHELLELLNSRGLLLTKTVDSVRALRYLKLDGYYRLSGYFWLFYDKSRLPEHHFKIGTTWDEVIHLYHADKDLRRLLLDALAEVEISIKSILTNSVCDTIKLKTQEDDPYWCWNKVYFKTDFLMPKPTRNVSGFDDFQQILKSSCKSSKAPSFLSKFRKANPSQMPYIWMMMQVLSFGEVVTIVNNLKPEYVQLFLAHFNLRSNEARGIFVSLNKLRNACAHHNRIWNNKIDECPKIPRILALKNAEQWVDKINDKQTLALMYFILLHMLEALHPSKSIKFKQDFSLWVQQLCNTP